MWPNPQETANLVTYTEEILYGNFLRRDYLDRLSHRESNQVKIWCASGGFVNFCYSLENASVSGAE